MTKRIIAILVLCTSLYGYAMQQGVAGPVFGTFLDEQITPETLPLLAPQLPQNDLVRIRGWLDGHKQIIKSLVTLRKPFLRGAPNFMILQRSINMNLQRQGIPNKSGWNYIFDVPGTNYVVQIAGIVNRKQNLLVANDPNPANPTLQDRTPDIMVDSVVQRIPPTYQTISRVAHYVRAQEAIDKFNLSWIMLPKTYIVGIDENLPAEANDNNSVVVQEKVPHVIPVKQMTAAQRASAISAEAVRQLFIVTIYASLWDLEANLLFDNNTGKFVISDFEQPNNSNPADFFHKRESKALGLSKGGMGKINAFFAMIPHLAPICKSFMALTDAQLLQIAAGHLPESVAARIE